METADLVTGIRKPFVDDIKQLRASPATSTENKGEIDRALQVLPIKLEKVGRTAIYGSWFNFYLCDFTGQRPRRRQADRPGRLQDQLEEVHRCR